MRGPRLGLVVPKKGTPLAARRNRVKRIVREQFRRFHDDLPAVDVVVQVFAAVEDDRLARCLRDGFGQIRERISGDGLD
jgi:RNase P protein component